MNSDRVKWNRIFAGKPEHPPLAPLFVKKYLGTLLPGNVLDIASGDGALSLYLAQQGFQVTAADISSEALKRLSSYVNNLACSIKTMEIDLDEPSLLANLPLFQNVTIFRYKPPVVLWPVIVDKLIEGGRILISTFNKKHHLKTGFSERYCLSQDELKGIHRDLKLISQESVYSDESDLDIYLMEKCTHATAP